MQGDRTAQARLDSDWDPAPVVAEGVHGERLLAEYARLRRQCPVAYSDQFGGYWTLTRYADVAKASRDWQHFGSGQPIVHNPDLPAMIPIDLDPPQHTPYRRMLNKYFSPTRMEQLEPAVRAGTIELLAPLLERASGDVVPELADPLSARTLCSLLNMSQATSGELIAHLAAAAAVRTDLQQLNALFTTLFDAPVRALVEERTREPLDPETDMMSGVLALEIDGRRIPPEDVVAIGTMFFAAGHDTTAQGLAAAIHHLAAHPQDQATLRSDPTLIPAAIEEILRLDPPVHQLGRRTTEAVDVDRRTIPAGCLVALSYLSANRDEVAFPEPDACILDRSPNKHMTFGHGVHKCIGAPLARLEMRVVLKELLARTTHFGPAGVPRPRNGRFEGGFDALPISFETTPERSA